MRTAPKVLALCATIVLLISESARCEPPEVVKNSIGMRLRLISAGKFAMGSPPNEPGRQPRETLHEVSLSIEFYIGIYEVTQREYALVMGKNPSHFGKDERERSQAAAESFDRHPVERVNWFEATDFCAKLSDRAEERAAGRSYRLPTEAEWEYACRAGGMTTWSFGTDRRQLQKHAWYRHRDSELTTQPVGAKEPNAWGLYDMHGNVWEWCQDWYQEDFGERSPKADPSGPKDGLSKVIRGGGYISVPAHTRSATRFHDPPTIGDEDVGFRVVMIPTKK